jgi:integrase
VANNSPGRALDFTSHPWDAWRVSHPKKGEYVNQQISGHVRLHQRKRGAKWYAKYRLPSGRQVQKLLGQKLLGPAWAERSRPPAGYFTKRTAEAALQALLTDARRGVLPDPGRTEGRTFGEACDEWLRWVEHDQQRARSTLRDYRNVVNGSLLPAFGKETPLEQIATESIDAYRARLLAEGQLSRRSVQKILVLLHGILKRAKRQKWIDHNPAEDAERVAVKRSGDFNVLTPAEVAAVARAASSELMGAIVTVAAFTGLRLGELRGLRWADIDFTKRMILVRHNLPCGGDEKAPKSEKVRSVPLIDQAARALDGLSRREHFTGPDERVFPSATGDPLDDGEIRDEFYAALKAAELAHLREKNDPIVFHDLRHTFGTLGAAVWPLHNLQGYMGHADIQTTMIYAHHVPKIEAADQLTAAVEAANGTVSRTVSRTAEIGGNSAQLSATNHA